MIDQKLIFFNDDRKPKGKGKGGDPQNPKAPEKPKAPENLQGKVVESEDEKPLGKSFHLVDKDVVYGQNDFRFVHCNSFRELTNFMDFQFKKMSTHLQGEWKRFQDENQEALDDNNVYWFGEPMPKSLDELEKINQFRHMEKFLQLQKNLQSELKKLKKLRKLDAIQVKKIAYNDREIGVFSFDRASMGLYKERQKDGTMKIVSDVKKSFVYFESKDSEKRFVRIYVQRPNSNVHHADELFFLGAYAAILSEELMNGGYDVEIIGVNGTTDFSSLKDGGFDFYATFTTFKKANTRLNLNDFLLCVADAAYMRYKGFKEQIAVYSHFKKDNIQTQNVGSYTFGENMPFLMKRLNKDTKYLLIDRVHDEKSLLESIINLLNEINETGTFKSN